jgi:hypothetical protein
MVGEHMANKENLAHAITLLLGRLTFASLHIFEELGVDMSAVDEALASWTTAYNELEAHNDELVTQLEAANETIEQLVATDAAEDSEQKAALEAQIAQQITTALELAKNPPAPPEPPPVTEPVEPEPVDPNAPHPDQTLPGDLQ